MAADCTSRGDSDEELRHLAAETGYNVAAVKLVRLRKPCHVRHRAVDGHAPALRTNDPDGASASRQPVFDFLLDLFESVAGAEDFDGEVGRGLPEVLRDARLRDSLAADEGYVGSAHGIRVARQFEPRLSAEPLP